MGILDINYPQTAPSGLLSPGAAAGVAPGQQKWLDALSAVSAGLKDAGAYLQHDPAAAGNVVAFARQRAGLQPAGSVPSLLANLSPTVLAALLLHAAQHKAAVEANVTPPNQQDGQTGAAAPLQNAPAQMLQPDVTQPANQTQTLPAQTSGWGVQKVR